MSPQRKPQTADETAKEALDRVVEGKTPTRRALAFLLADNEPPPTPVTPVTPDTPVTRVTGDASPKRDFTKTANSIVREAVPAGAFTGKGKQLYDYLYSQTRGAIVPKMSVRLPTENVMQGAHMTRPTYRNHIARLEHLGLVVVEQRAGQHGGNLFTVYLPEEAGFERGNRGNTGNRGISGNPGNNLDGQQGKEIYPGNTGLTADYQRTSDESKTLIQDKERIDDEAFAPALALIRQASREVTGRDPSPADAQRWLELAEVLTTELKIAAGRTTVSSVPAFLAEHLRRRLWKKDKREIECEAAESGPRGDSVQMRADSKNCPDCFGTGMWYPEGFDKGVARCRHENLKR